MITGGTDYCGFPMRHGILGVRKRIVMYKGTGFKGGLKGMKKRKTVCGHKINDKISAVNLKVLKEGSKKLSELFSRGKEEKAKDTKLEKKEEKPKPEVKEDKKKDRKSQEAKQEGEKQKPEPKKEAKQEPEKKQEEKK